MGEPLSCIFMSNPSNNLSALGVGLTLLVLLVQEFDRSGHHHLELITVGASWVNGSSPGSFSHKNMRSFCDHHRLIYNYAPTRPQQPLLHEERGGDVSLSCHPLSALMRA